MKTKTIEEIYQKKDLHSHILTRPSMYVGSIKSSKEEQWVVEDCKIKRKVIDYIPGLFKIFDEVLVNALDHSIREPTVKNIKIDITSNEITVFNDGKSIPIVKHKEHGIYIPELIFGNLLTSSNYDDSQKRIVGGMNGLGSKLTCVFSKYFNVELVEDNYKYIQTFSDNMYEKTEPKITKVKVKPYTKITFRPDFERFGIKKLQLSKDFISFLQRRVYDCIATTNKNVNIYLNGNKLEGKDLMAYTKFFELNSNVFYEKIEKDNFIWEICVCKNDNFQQISFVNGINTYQGGKHIDFIVNQITKKLSEMIQTKKKIKDVKPSYIKDKLFVFLRATIQNPEFTSQTKECLSTSYKNFGINFEISDTFITKLYKSEITEEILSFVKFKSEKVLSKTDGKKKTRLFIDNLEDANFAGHSTKSKKCSLMLTEGLSAKTFAISGFSVVGRDYYGVFPLKGKLLNVREATQAQLLKNEEINNIKQILGLQHGKKYTSTESLRYGSIIILADQDSDGIHIVSLVINFFHYFWPELLEIKGFIKRMKTPIVKVSKRNEILEFFTIQDFIKWKEDVNTKSWNTKYYKGLGTSTALEAKNNFKNIDNNLIKFVSQEKEETEQVLLLAFEKKQADNRKLWLQKYNYNLIPDQTISDLSYQDFINKELIHFSIYDTVRSVPSLVDGLKPSQRKVLYTLFTKKYQKEIKVAQLGASVAEMTDYHHGEASLFGTIINMAQDYTGSNNINLLDPIGQFGTLLHNGKDSASPRYIFTKLNEISYKIFNEDDFNILDYNKDDNENRIEPKFYIPIIPMILVNGACGIGTGYSTKIPCYNPKDIIENIIRILNKKEVKKIIPWYRNFKGKIKENETGNYDMYGKFNIEDNSIKITEIPIETSVDDYIKFLNKQIEDKVIIDYINNSTDTEVNITIKLQNLEEFLAEDKKLIYKKLKLIKPINVSNYHLFDISGTIKRYATAEDILKEFVDIRLQFNQKRKDYLLCKYSKELDILKNKIRFLEEIINDKIVIYKKSKEEIKTLLKERKYLSVDNTFNYLLDMSFSMATKEKLEDLKNKHELLDKKHNILSNKTIKDIFEEDLNSIKYD